LVLPSQLRRRLGVALLIAFALVPVGVAIALAASSRGLTGEATHAWQTLTNPKAVVLNDPSRLAQLSNSRPRYWGEGLNIGAHAPLHGVGAGGFPILQPRYASDHRYRVQHAHSYVIETFADLGALGLAVSFVLLVGWALATARTFGWRAQKQGFEAPAVRAGDAERVGLLTLLCVMVAFGLHATIDWTWSIPGTAIPALICAGWLAGRGPLGQRVGRRAQRLRLAAAPGRAAATAVLLAVGLAAMWTVWQPLRSADADAAAVSALTRGDADAALGDARAAVARDPLAPAPLWQLADVYSALGDLHAAHAELVRAISLQPENAATWTALGLFNLNHDQPHKALGVLQRAQRLDPLDPQIPAAIARAQAALAAKSQASGAGS
jgi:O-Antigen ligase/Tetratricopeptide repeat